MSQSANEPLDPEVADVDNAAAPTAETDPAEDAHEGTDPAAVDPDADGDGEVSPLEAELAERTEDLQRVTAEYANYRRIVERDRAVWAENAKADVAAKLLPIVDDLDMAAAHGDLEGPLKAVADKLNSVLEGLNVEAFGEQGDSFDPEHHEAVQDTSTGETKVLGTVLRKGYRLHQRVLRNALVIIEDPAQEQAEGAAEESAD